MLASLSYSQNNHQDIVVLNLQEQNIVELIVTPSDYKLTVEVIKVVANSEDEIIYSVTKTCDKPSKSWWVSKRGNYKLVASRIFEGEKVILQKETFNINN